MAAKRLRETKNTSAVAAAAMTSAALPALTQLAEKAREDYGDAYAGGQIGASMAKVLND